MKMLVVEDEAKIMDNICHYFRREGWEVYPAEDGLQAMQIFTTHQPFDMVTLDWMLPERDGLEVCREIRARSTVPIIFLTAKTDEIDKLLGLELGADDYITKPFSLRELATRIKVILQRVQPDGHVPHPVARGTSSAAASQAKQGVLERGELRILRDEHRVILHGRELALTPTEFVVICLHFWFFPRLSSSF
ncbi:DNA-binding response OmpR family regulator [Caldalkalibacillus uzonensis]|uniref:DNA-binding response OmpR family regulator n=2 Tax=Caldalkalibacillus uzonensis TaxID=353224 RepID=A0ABU0CLW4_9BACI|nr:DNA-binding response OmpR family regulator [Caldalkalibacillus uzonensis]